jgi:hypothetical protein
MRWEVRVVRNTLSVTEEKVVVEASTKEEAVKKAKLGDYEDVEIVECSDISELSSEFSEPKKLD